MICLIPLLDQAFFHTYRDAFFFLTNHKSSCTKFPLLSSSIILHNCVYPHVSVQGNTKIWLLFRRRPPPPRCLTRGCWLHHYRTFRRPDFFRLRQEIERMCFWKRVFWMFFGKFHMPQRISKYQPRVVGGFKHLLLRRRLRRRSSCEI